MDPNTSASGGAPSQNTSPIMDPAELRDIIVRQGAIIRSYQDQVEALQNQLRSASTATPRDPPIARGGKDISVQLMELRQGTDTAADYTIKFRTLAAQSGWNDASLWAVFRAGLNPELQTELACRAEATTLSQFVATAIPRPDEAVLPLRGLRTSELSLPVKRDTGKALLDSRAAVNLIDGALVERLGITTFPYVPSLRITVIDSQPIGEGYLKRQTELLEFRVGLFHQERLPFYITSSPDNPNQVLRPCRASHVRKLSPPPPDHLPQAYAEFREVFSKERASHLPAHQPWDCAIDLLPNASPPRGQIYPLLLPESKAMEEYIETALAAGHIQPSTSPAAAGFFSWRHHLYVKLEKCEFHRTTATFLGYVISQRGVEMDMVKVRAVTDWPAPTTVRELQRFLGFVNFYRRFIRNYSSVAGPLTSLLRGKPKRLAWTDQARAAFQQLKESFTSASILRYPDPDLPFVVEVDASSNGFGAVLSMLW
ncbi:hypothetical protein QTP70_021657 [Hemibagrus guttatus]|uniref:Reverse transcriptase/retrotransposon-derived protein RNase H-like domain-containing protein n=1 Tax=Hemibagrus guttatus TaxID=175788 RepID=A0AAE0VC91_9TELE|nr:hypothetical protein QTP70_021657 [Hemibagrus guttatus]